MSFLALCGVLILSAVFMLIIREYSKPAASMVGIAVAVGAFVYAVHSASDIITSLGEITAAQAVAPYMETLLKGLGVAYLSTFCASVCRDMGADNAARISELLGKIQIVILSVPLTLELMELAGELLA